MKGMENGNGSKGVKNGQRDRSAGRTPPVCVVLKKKWCGEGAAGYLYFSGAVSAGGRSRRACGYRMIELKLLS